MLRVTRCYANRAVGNHAAKKCARSDSGAEAVEFALVLPLFLTLLFGVTTMGIVFWHYEMLVGATEAGARTFAAARGTATPYTTALSAMTNYATGLNSQSLTSGVSFSVNGQAPCTTDALCISALTNAQGTPATVKATYPCTIVIMGANLAPNCNLTQTLTESIE
jgi:Flp pilus assembly protein TadG